MDDELLNTLLKKATGYSQDEVQEEYSVGEDGIATLSKRKITKKYYPPDNTALKTYLELLQERPLTVYTDEELESEKKRLLGELQAVPENNKNINKEKKCQTSKKKL